MNSQTFLNLLQPREVAKVIKAVASLGAVGLQQPQAVVMVQSTHRTPASLENSWDAVNLGHRKSLFAKQLQT